MKNKNLLIALGLILAATAVAGAQSLSNLPRASEVVKPRAYVSLEPVPRGRTFEIAIVAEVMPGFHINANKVMDDYLIPTSVSDLPKGLQLLEAKYPEGQLQKFDFSEKMLNVYDGTVVLRMKVKATADAPLGPANQNLTLRYQACNDRACLPPVKLPVPVTFTVAEAGTKATPVNQEIFKPAKR